ncbi:MAG TPA: hypothetical protein VG125_17780 [Pirellulales bacterium]|jgi:hypothetical protein|nr:hypothetical protein [Pirellulales bacterium]
MQLLVQFIMRLSFGLAAAMLCVSPRQVTSGYYRNNLYVLLGLAVLASLAAWMSDSALAVWPPVVVAVASYLGAVAWLYEKAGPGLAALAVIAGGSLAGAWLSQPAAATDAPAGVAAGENVATGPSVPGDLSNVLWTLDPVGGGLVLGVTMASMLLGHWYLNAPGMPLAPLKRLVACMVAALLVRALLAAIGLALEQRTETFDLSQWLFVAMRWSMGVVGGLIVAVMARQTLKIPNTQSATGILYVGVVLTFVGELTAQLLSRGKPFPL